MCRMVVTMFGVSVSFVFVVMRTFTMRRMVVTMLGVSVVVSIVTMVVSATMFCMHMISMLMVM